VGAADLYWDANGTIPGAGITPSGTWGVDAFWNDQSDGGGAGTIGAWVSNSNAHFSAGTDATGAFTVTLSAAQTVGNIFFEEGNAHVDGGTMNFTDFTVATIDVAGTSSATISTVIGGTVAPNKSGAGTLTLTRSNTYTGFMVLSAGTIVTVGSNVLPD